MAIARAERYDSRIGALCAAGAGIALAMHAWRASRQIDFAGKSVVILGGSRGLGLVIARELADEGARLTIAARDAAELERAGKDLETRGADVRMIVCDVRDRDQVQSTIDGAAARRGGIDVLVNVAGVIQVGPAGCMTTGDFENAMATHFWGPLHAILAARPYLQQSPIARIVNISSIGGKIAVPHLLPYSASKFALTGLSEGLCAELAQEGIRVTTVCPGLMRTGSTYNAWFKGQHRREFAWFHNADAAPGLSISAVRAARQIIAACRRGDPVLVITPAARLGVIANAVCPQTTARVMQFVNWLLPSPGSARAVDSRSGWQSVSSLAPTVLTRSADQATKENNEVPGVS
jgi:NAD(P)-dependent dehydrogenase (short-subunit alcohol dehydrogenase family)